MPSHLLPSLSPGQLRGLVDPELKPNKLESAAIERIVSSPSDELTLRDKDLLWKFRYTLVTKAKALTKFMLCVDWLEESEVTQATRLLAMWRARAPIDVADALKLLGPERSFQHEVVRSFAVETLRGANDAELLAYLLQLVQALRYEPRTSPIDVSEVALQWDVGCVM